MLLLIFHRQDLDSKISISMNICNHEFFKSDENFKSNTLNLKGNHIFCKRIDVI